jgi:dolichol-phosphate mannosyltransferase
MNAGDSLACMPAENSIALMNWALVVPMANEENEFVPFIREIYKMLEILHSGKVYLITDNASHDRTTELCNKLAQQEPRFVAVWAPENKNLTQAYLRGYREAFAAGHDYIVEMDAGLSHDPHAIPLFLEALSGGARCAWGSRFVNGGSMAGSTVKRKFFSLGGTILANMLLGTHLHDMTSGFQGFPRSTVERFVHVPLRSSAHFYQTELRYLLRRYPSVEIPIHYQAPSPRVSAASVMNSLKTLFYYFWRRLTFRAVAL